MVYGYVVVYGCAKGNRLAKWYWDCEHLKPFDFEISWFMDMSWFTDVLKAIG